MQAEVQRRTQLFSESQAPAYIAFAHFLLAKASKMVKPKVKEGIIWL